MNPIHKLSFFLPVYNKQSSIREVVEIISNSSKEFSLDIEIVAIDDRSTDNSWSELLLLSSEDKRIKISQNKENLGFSATYSKCIELANSEYGMCISTDGDIEKSELTKVLKELGKKPLIVQHFEDTSDRTIIRRTISNGYTFVLNKINGINLKYYNGCNIYPMRFLKKLNILESSFAFQAVVTIAAVKELEYLEVGINGKFCDENSSATSIKNILGVMSYLGRSIIKRAKWIL